MTPTLTRTVTITVSPVSLGEQLDDSTIAAICDNGFQRLQGAMCSLIDQGICSGTLTFQRRQPAVNLHWTISVLNEPSTVSLKPQAQD